MQICRETQGDPNSYRARVGSPDRLSGPVALRRRDRAPHVKFSAMLLAVLGLAAPARADDGVPPPQPEPALAYTGDLDGHYLHLGALGGAVRIEASWDGAFGGQLAWLRIRERRALSAIGVAVSGSRYSERDGGRAWIEAIAGTRRLGDVLIGVSVGPAVELSAIEHPRAGVTGAAWVFAGVVPYVRGGTFQEAGAFVEVGLAITLPVWRW